MEYSSTSAVNTKIVMRRGSSTWRWLMPGLMLRRMFSTKLVDGASSVADEVDLMADTSAPKKKICAMKGIFDKISVGSTFCGSLASSSLVSAGMISSDE